MTVATAADDWYRHRCREVEEEQRVIAGKTRIIANVRLVLFLMAVGLLVLSETVGTMGAPPIIGAALFAVAFFGAVIFHAKLRERDSYLTTVRTVYDEALHRMQRQWDSLPPSRIDVPEDHPYARDLDITGAASVAQLLGSVRTPIGRRTLLDWLLAPSPPSVIRSRQAAVQELAPKLMFREHLEVMAYAARSKHEDEVESFLIWTTETPWLAGRQGLVWLARSTAVASTALLLMHLLSISPYAWWLIPVIVNIFVTGRIKESIHDRFRRAAAYESALPSLASMLELFSADQWKSELLKGYHEALTSGPHAAAEELRRLRRILSFAEFRETLLYPIVQWFVLWDVHVLKALEGWRSVHGAAVRGWLDRMGPVEALSGFAGLARDNPSWCFPEVVDGDRIEVVAEGLGHPLLSDANRVPNDVRIGPPGTFLLVTGSNMSGKSTLLRAIGVNVVLAHAGAPACCHRLRFPPVRLWTSMRIDDSLERGVSFFMAGLQRLKLIIESARESVIQPTLLYLLDEIMQGTNSAERSVAVREVVRELIDRGAIGAVTTHDLSLADAPELVAAANPVHFTETVDPSGDRFMTFDYTLRQGIATSRNALRLMELMGLRHQ